MKGEGGSMRTVCDGVLGVIGRRCRTGHGVLRSTRVASECGGLCMGSEPRSRARWGVARAQTRAYLGAALAAAARCFLGSGIGLYRCTEARERSGCALRGPPIFAWQKANFIFVFTVWVFRYRHIAHHAHTESRGGLASVLQLCPRSS